MWCLQVDCGRDLMLSDVQVDVKGDRLLITGGDRARSRRRGSAAGGPSRSPGSSDDDRSAADDQRQPLIKQFTLPQRAQVDAITSRRGDDGRLAILVPVRR